MKAIPYKAEITNGRRYVFDSIGPKGTIKKVVEITALNRKDTFNVGFGDVRNDGTIDDQTETNNDDLIRVFATVIEIMRDFIDKNPSALLFFRGSTDQRTAVYQYILKRNFAQFAEKFNITGIIMIDGIPHQIEYDPMGGEPFLAFLIKKKN